MCGRHGACWGCLWSPSAIREELRAPGHHSSSAPPGCWDLAVPSRPARPCEQRGRRWMDGKGALSYSELPLPPPVLPCSTLSPAPSILQD